MTTTLELIGGQRRQVVVGIRKDSIHWDEVTGECFVRLGREKATNRSSHDFPLPKEVGDFLRIFITHIRPLMLQPGMPEPVGLWIDSRGSSLSGAAFTKRLKRLVKAFHPDMDVSPILWRRAVVTDIFRGMDVDQLSDLDVQDIFRFLNVSLLIAQKYYNRLDSVELDRRIQAMINAPIRSAIQEELEQALAVAASYVQQHPALARSPAAAPAAEARLPRLVLDDAEWARVYELHRREIERRAKEARHNLAALPATPAESQASLREREERENLRKRKVEQISAAVAKRGRDEQQALALRDAKRRRKEEFLQLERLAELHVSVTEEMETHGRQLQSVHGSAWKHYQVKKLTDKGVNSDGKLFYCVKWKGERRKTWEPAEELHHRCWALIENYEILHWNQEKAAQSRDHRKHRHWQELLKLDDLEKEWSEQKQMEPSLLENIKEEKDALDGTCGELQNNHSKTKTNTNDGMTNLEEKDFQNYFDSFF
jgi:hypothetical protein